MIPTLFFPVIEKNLQQFLSASFLDVTEIDENEVVTDFLRRRYPAGAAFMHPNVALEKPRAAALFWLPSAAGTSHLKGSKSSCQNRSFFCGCCPDAAQMSNSLVLIPAGQQRSTSDGCHVKGGEKGNMGKQVVYTALLYIRRLLVC